MIIKAAQLHEQTLWRKFAWDSKDRRGSIAKRNKLPDDESISQAVDIALRQSPDVIYLDDAHGLDEFGTAELMLRVRRYTGNVRLCVYGWPRVSAVYARNVQKENTYKWRQNLWNNDTHPISRVVDFAAPSLYMKTGVEAYTDLSVADAWQLVATEAMLIASRLSMPIIPFVSILPSKLKTETNAKRMAWTLRLWHTGSVIDGVVVWGKDQNLLLKNLDSKENI